MNCMNHPESYQVLWNTLHYGNDMKLIKGGRYFRIPCGSCSANGLESLWNLFSQHLHLTMAHTLCYPCTTYFNSIPTFSGLDKSPGLIDFPARQADFSQWASLWIFHGVFHCWLNSGLLQNSYRKLSWSAGCPKDWLGFSFSRPDIV